MKKRVYCIVAFLCIAGVLPVAAGAAAGERLIANIPFDFSMAGKTLPAGQYEVTELRPSVLMLRNQTKTDSVAIVVVIEDSSNRVDKPRLDFHRYGQSYFLAGVYTNTIGIDVAESHAEREAKIGKDHLAQGRRLEVVSLSATLRH